MAVNKVVIDGVTAIDLTNDTVSADKLLKGITAHDSSGKLIVGTMGGDSLLPKPYALSDFWDFTQNVDTAQNSWKSLIATLRSYGFGYATIAKAVNLKKGTVVAYCRKIGLTGTKAMDNRRIDVYTDFCLQCGALLAQTPGRKRIKFCCDKCRISWWNSHPEKVNRKAVYNFTCANCGKLFTAYGNSGRKYCSHACYIADRFKGGDCDE